MTIKQYFEFKRSNTKIVATNLANGECIESNTVEANLLFKILHELQEEANLLFKILHELQDLQRINSNVEFNTDATTDAIRKLKG